MPPPMKRLTRGTWSWALYDWANSAFVLSILTVFYGGVFINHWYPGPAEEAFFWQGVSVTIGGLIMLPAAPLLGTLANRGPVKKRYLAAFMLLGVGGSLALAMVPAGAWQWALALRIIASLGFFGSLIFYDALITDVSTPRNRHFVSALGFSIGYGGSVLLLIAQFAVLQNPALLGLPDKMAAVRLAFVSVAVWWLVFSLPLLLRVRETDTRKPLPMAETCRQCLHDLRINFRKLKAHRAALLFLIAYFFYIDGVNSLIQMVSGFAATVGVAEEQLIAAIILVQVVGVPCAILLGLLGQRFGPRPVLFGSIGVYLCVTLAAVRFSGTTVVIFGWPVGEIYLLAALIGAVQGGLQAISRSYFANLIPAGEETAFFGFFNMLGKGGAILGPFFMGAIGLWTQDVRWGFLGVSLLFLVGGLLLIRAKTAAWHNTTNVSPPSSRGGEP